MTEIDLEVQELRRKCINLKFALMSSKRALSDYQEALEWTRNKLQEVEAERDRLIDKYEPKENCEE